MTHQLGDAGEALDRQISSWASEEAKRTDCRTKKESMRLESEHRLNQRDMDP